MRTISIPSLPKTLLGIFVGATLSAQALAAPATLLATPADQTQHDITRAQAITVDSAAHWLQQKALFIKPHESAVTTELYYSLNGDIPLTPSAVNLGSTPYLSLTPIATNHQLAEKYAYLLPEFSVFSPSVEISNQQLKELVKGQLLAVQRDKAGNIVHASQIQKAKLIDAIYTSSVSDADEVTDLGATIQRDAVQFKLWAPTAHKVSVLLFDKNKAPLAQPSLAMEFDTNTGVWSAKGSKSLNRKYYQYQVTAYHPATRKVETLATTDPYSLSLSTNSLYTQVIDLDDKDTKPRGWDKQKVPALAHYEDATLYELHIRDFSAVEKNLSKPQYRGKYKAFSERKSDGIKHLKRLRKAGLTHIHLMPAFDIGTVDEDPNKVIFLADKLEKVCTIAPETELCKNNPDRQSTLRDILASYSPASGDAQAVIESIRTKDPYNWGYDPYHYTVPEGSYAVNPDGKSRIVEFREMVRAIHRMGFRVVMDVVYNHTYQARLNEKSVLDKIVPNYYYRLNPVSGDIEQSTCCDNTATENKMMGKLMIDSLVVWADAYKIDGFRFDLMGHQPKYEMLQAFEAVKQVDPDTYFYGEGWNFGEVANNRIFAQATQTELSGSEIGTFTDRMRDAIRGGAPFDGAEGIRRGQGLSNGLYTLPNDLQAEDKNYSEYLLSMDQVRLGLAGNLVNYPMIDTQDTLVTGRYIPYGGAPTGYALDPADTVNYVSKHDNQTLWDNNQYRIPYQTSSDDRVRMQTLALAYSMFSQGVPFIHMGSELLRSKSFLRDSYDYGDWFNAVDFSMQNNNYNVGLPPAVKDENNWGVIKTLLEKNEGRDHVSPEQIQYSAEIFMEWLKIRYSSPLFRLTTEQDIVARVSFINTGKAHTPGLIAMKLNDNVSGADLDSKYESIIVLFNNSAGPISYRYEGAANYSLHPVQAKSVDAAVREGAKASASNFEVPGFSVAVFVAK